MNWQKERLITRITDSPFSFDDYKFSAGYILDKK